jgi:hypothetical protein
MSQIFNNTQVQYESQDSHYVIDNPLHFNDSSFQIENNTLLVDTISSHINNYDYDLCSLPLNELDSIIKNRLRHYGYLYTPRVLSLIEDMALKGLKISLTETELQLPYIYFSKTIEKHIKHINIFDINKYVMFVINTDFKNLWLGQYINSESYSNTMTISNTFIIRRFEKLDDIPQYYKTSLERNLITINLDNVECWLLKNTH